MPGTPNKIKISLDDPASMSKSSVDSAAKDEEFKTETNKTHHSMRSVSLYESALIKQKLSEEKEALSNEELRRRKTAKRDQAANNPTISKETSLGSRRPSRMNKMQSQPVPNPTAEAPAGQYFKTERQPPKEEAVPAKSTPKMTETKRFSLFGSRN